MKRLWVNANPFRHEAVTMALESGAEALVLADGESPKVRHLGRIKTVEKDGDLRPGVDVEFITITSKADEDRAAAVPQPRIVVLHMQDWTIIPIENLLARRKSNILVEVSSAQQARLMVEILEKGVDGVLLDTPDVNEIKKTEEVLRGISERITLVEATVSAVKQLGMGDRACLDTCTQMTLGQGMLVGNTASGFLLVHSESIENPYVSPRPFRVNAGAVHAYAMTPGGKTKYLADLRAGDEVLVVDSGGHSQTAFLGRNKIERRPLLLVEAVAQGQPVSLILQNAETICLVAPDGSPLSVTRLKAGDRVMAHVEKVGRHFGMQVDETLIER